MNELRLKVLEVNLNISNAVVVNDWNKVSAFRTQLGILIDQMISAMAREKELTN